MTPPRGEDGILRQHRSPAGLKARPASAFLEPLGSAYFNEDR